MKALHVYRTYFPDPQGGMQEAIRQACLSTQQQGIKNTVYTLSPNPEPHEVRRPEARVVRAKSWWAPASCDFGAMAALSLFKREVEKADVLHYWFPWPYADLLDLTAKISMPSVLTYVSDVVRQRWLGKAYSPLMWRTLRNMKAIVANCPAYAETSPVLKHPAIRNKVRVIPLGIVESSYPAVGDPKILQRLGLDDGEPFVLFVGVLRYYKGLHTLLEAAESIRAKIVIAGTGPEGDSLRQRAAMAGLRNVVFAGQVSDEEKVALLQACSALVLPSHLRSEAYGMVLVEASIFGKPMVTCEIGTGTSYVNKHEESGLVIPPEVPGALAEAINLLLNDQQLAGRLGQGARCRYERLFSGPAMGRAYADLFREVAA